MLKITGAKAVVACPGRNFVTLKIETSEGVHGLFPHAYRFDRGLMHPGEAPRLGVDLDGELAARYEYEPAYLPVNRLEDGTMWNW
jgi:mannonate dehydratase